MLDHPTAAAAARVFQSLAELRARPAERADLPDAALLRRAIESDGEISEHYRRALRDWPADRNRQQSMWLRGALAAFGIEHAYFVALGPKGSPWWHVEPEDPVDWLATLAQRRDDEAPEGHGLSPIRSRQGRGVEDLTVLSLDGRRALLLQTHEDELKSFSFFTDVLVHRAESGDRLLALVKALHAPPRAAAGEPPLDPRARLRNALQTAYATGFWANSQIRIQAEALRPRSHCRIRWSWDTSTGERSRFFLEALEALDSAPITAPTGERFYMLSIGAVGPLTWIHTARCPPPDWISTLWDRGSLDRLFIVEKTESAVLGFLATTTGIEGFLYDMAEVRSV